MTFKYTILSFPSLALMEQLGTSPKAADNKAPCFEIALETSGGPVCIQRLNRVQQIFAGDYSARFYAVAFQVVSGNDTGAVGAEVPQNTTAHFGA